MYVYEYMVIILFFSSLFVYVSKYKHFLLMLLSLEMVVLSLYMGMFMYISFYSYEYFTCMVFLVMGVSEGVLGLSLLVMIMYSHGSDMVLSFDALW
uniref:NADH-ubiquinone oxidoreductase chain 4L n=1 Tax=Trigonopterus kotamobagensis TaxID=2583401 RepID=A0A7H1KI27_9CUCU|nr:NADH dehydrogenase subunit 4L [Trigonopterus kotamobagensis]QNT26943.1 NADH dehydrogenase subunit 4L [Trigonopterus kotamobagensis]